MLVAGRKLRRRSARKLGPFCQFRCELPPTLENDFADLKLAAA